MSDRPRFRKLGLGLAIAILVALVGAGALYLTHHSHLKREAQRREKEVDRGPRVFVAEAKLAAAVREQTLPADVRGFYQSSLYAKIAGYVKSISVDRGDSVKAGQKIGILESPEVDQQVAAAVADEIIKRRTMERYQKLVTKDFVSRQDYETARAQYGVSAATLKQMRALQEYKVLRAPFTGTVTARYVDPGALIPAATGSNQGALPLVDVADLRRLRITVFVQQDSVAQLSVGDPTEITVDQQPDIHIRAPISRISRALDPRSRTMLCEIWIDNDYKLYPGTFVHVKLQLKRPPVPLVPSSAVLIHDDQPMVALIDDKHVRFKPVKTGLDDGKTVQILDGLEAGQVVALNVPAEIADGALVQPIEQPREGGATGGGAKKSEP